MKPPLAFASLALLLSLTAQANDFQTRPGASPMAISPGTYRCYALNADGEAVRQGEILIQPGHRYQYGRRTGNYRFITPGVVQFGGVLLGSSASYAVQANGMPYLILTGAQFPGQGLTCTK